MTQKFIWHNLLGKHMFGMVFLDCFSTLLFFSSHTVHTYMHMLPHDSWRRSAKDLPDRYWIRFFPPASPFFHTCVARLAVWFLFHRFRHHHPTLRVSEFFSCAISPPGTIVSELLQWSTFSVFFVVLKKHYYISVPCST